MPLPSYIGIAFTNPEMTRRIYQDADIAAQVIGRCVGGLVVTKLAADLKLKPPNEWEHACLGAILGTGSRDVRHCLTQPGAIELVNMVSLAFSSSLWATEVPPDVCDVLQQTLAILSKAIPAQENSGLQDALKNIISDDKSEHRDIVFRLHALLKMCKPGASPLMEEVRLSCLRMCLKILWHCSTTYHQASDPLPSYFYLVLASPEITRHFQTERDPVVRMAGCCFGALIASKLVNSLPPRSHISLDGRVDNAILASISAILGKEHREDVLLPYQVHIINFRNVVSLMSGEIDTMFTGIPTEVLDFDIAEQTLAILAEPFKITSPLFIPVPMVQRRLLGQIHSIVTDAGRRYRLTDQTVTLGQLRQVLEKLLPTVE